MSGQGEPRTSNLLKIANALEIDFWRLMVIAGYPVPDGSTEVQEFIAGFPWIEDFAQLLAGLKPEQRVSVKAYIRLLQEQSKSQ